MERKISRIMNDVRLECEYGPIPVTIHQHKGLRRRPAATLHFPKPTGPVTLYDGDVFTMNIPVEIKGDRGYGS